MSGVVSSLATAAMALVHDGAILHYLVPSCELLLLLEDRYALATHVRKYLKQSLDVDYLGQMAAGFKIVDW